MAEPIKKALDIYVAASNTVKRSSDVAPLMGVTGTELMQFFDGTKLLTAETIGKIATFLSVPISEAMLEHIDAIKGYYEGLR